MTNREFMSTLSDYDLSRYLYTYVVPIIGKSYNQSILGVADWLGKEQGEYDKLWEEKNGTRFGYN